MAQEFNKNLFIKATFSLILLTISSSLFGFCENLKKSLTYFLHKDSKEILSLLFWLLLHYCLQEKEDKYFSLFCQYLLFIIYRLNQAERLIDFSKFLELLLLD